MIKTAGWGVTTFPCYVATLPPSLRRGNAQPCTAGGSDLAVLCAEFCTRLCCTFFFQPFYFTKLFPQQCPCMAPHGSNMAPTVHNITIWFEQILACRFPHSHLAQVSNVSLEIRVFRSCLVRKLGWRGHFPSYYICCLFTVILFPQGRRNGLEPHWALDRY